MVDVTADGAPRASQPSAAGRHVRVALDAEPRSLARARQAMVGFCHDCGLTEDIAADVRLAVTEACANVVLHAYPDGPQVGAPLEVEATMRDDELVIVVRDRGRGVRPRADSPGSGFGLPLIGSVTTRLELRGGRGGAPSEVVMGFAVPGHATA